MKPPNLFSPELVELMRTLIREELAMQTPQSSPALMTVAEAAARTRVRPRTIRGWIRTGILPAQRVGGHHRSAHRVGDRMVPAMVGGHLLIAPADLDAAIGKPKTPPSKLSPEARAARDVELLFKKRLVATSK